MAWRKRISLLSDSSKPLLLKIFLAFSFLVCGFVAPAQAKYAAIVIDAASGEVLHAENASTMNYPASMTKMMTLYMVFEALAEGRIKLNDQMKVSRRATNQPPSKLALARGSTITVQNAILALVTKSANDVAMVVAEHLGGTEEKFAAKMTARAHALGMTRTTFRNASGLPNPGQLSTARDMAKLAQALIYDYPQYYHYFSRRSFKYKGNTYYNHNKLLGKVPGMDGLKTGYIRAAGYNLAASAKRGDRRLVVVVFGGASSSWRNDQVAALMRAGFNKDRRKLRIASHDSKSRVIYASQLLANRIPKPGPKPGSEAHVMTASAELPGISPPPLPDAKSVSIPPVMTRPVSFNLIADATAREPTRLMDPSMPPVLSASEAQSSSQINGWSVQVGAFRDPKMSNRAIVQAVDELPHYLQHADPVLIRIQSGGAPMYRARLTGLEKEAARSICKTLNQAGKGCLAVPPSGWRS